MKSATIPFPREFAPGDVGRDCRAVKRALAVVLGGPHGMALKTNTFAAKTAGVNLANWKLSVGLLHTPDYTLQAHEKLIAVDAFDAFGASLMAKEAYSLAATQQRNDYVAGWRWAVEHHAENVYSETRPIPFWLAPFETSTTIYTDCSGESALLAKWENLVDPSGMGFNGQGNTGAILHHCARVAAGKALPGDLIVYRAGSWDAYGHHVVAILRRLPGGDFEIGSNGHQGDPGDYTHSAMLATQTAMGYPDAVFCRFLPAP